MVARRATAVRVATTVMAVRVAGSSRPTPVRPSARHATTTQIVCRAAKARFTGPARRRRRPSSSAMRRTSTLRRASTSIRSHAMRHSRPFRPARRRWDPRAYSSLAAMPPMARASAMAIATNCRSTRCAHPRTNSGWSTATAATGARLPLAPAHRSSRATSWWAAARAHWGSGRRRAAWAGNQAPRSSHPLTMVPIGRAAAIDLPRQREQAAQERQGAGLVWAQCGLRPGQSREGQPTVVCSSQCLDREKHASGLHSSRPFHWLPRAAPRNRRPVLRRRGPP